MLEKLWKDIQYIYDVFNFSSISLIDDLMIISRDNYYQLYYKTNENTTQIRIEKDFNLVKMWSDDLTTQSQNYKIHVEVDSKIEIDKNYKIELTYKIITPFLREVKLNKIGV